MKCNRERASQRMKFTGESTTLEGLSNESSTNLEDIIYKFWILSPSHTVLLQVFLGLALTNKEENDKK